VATPGTLQFSNVFLKILVFLLKPLIWLITVKKEVCAEFMIFALLDANKGLYRRDNNANDIGMKGFPDAPNAAKLLWDHTIEATTISR